MLIAFVKGSLLLFDSPESAPFLSVSLGAIVAMAGVLLLFSLLAGVAVQGELSHVEAHCREARAYTALVTTGALPLPFDDPPPLMPPSGIERARPLPVDDTLRPPTGPLLTSDHWDASSDVILYRGRCEELLATMPTGVVQLVVTSPPYNIGKAYEQRVSLDNYLQEQASIIREAVRVLAPGGSICWQVGNHVDDGEVYPLDIMLYPIFKRLGLQLRNRIIWHFEHGLHSSRRLSGRYETILWFTKGRSYYFDLNSVRVPQKYPNKKAFKGPRIGQLTGNPLGKNPGDVWIIPNVKWNHVEKTDHPCQFPVELVERLILSMTRPGDWVLDPFGGTGTSLVAAALNGRRGAMAEITPGYAEIASSRLRDVELGTLRVRPMGRPVYQPR